MKITPTNKIKREILLQAEEKMLLDTNEQISEAYKKFVETGNHYDYENEFREGQEKTGIDAPYSRHYESHSVARKMSDGSWIGWVYWYGGGKHGNPEEVEWMDDAYELNCVEETKMVTVKTFKMG